MEDKVYTLSQVRRLEWWPVKSDSAMRGLIKSGQISYTTVNGKYHFEEADLRSFLSERKTTV